MSSQPPPQVNQTAALDPAWAALRSQQQRELALIDSSVEADKIKMRQQFEAAQTELRRRFEAGIADRERYAATQRTQLLVRHQKQDYNLWLPHKHHAQPTIKNQGAPTNLRQTGPSPTTVTLQKETVGKGSTVTSQQAKPATAINTLQRARPASTTQKKSITAANQTQTARTPAVTPKKPWPTTPTNTPRTPGRRRTKYDGFTEQPTPEQEKDVAAVSLLSDDEDDMPLMQRLAHNKGSATATKPLPLNAVPSAAPDSTKDSSHFSVSH